MPQRRADGAPGGVDARDEHEVADPEHVLIGDRILVARVDEVGDEVVFARVLFAIVELGLEELQNLEAAFQSYFRIGEPHFEHAAHPSGEFIGHLGGYPEHGGDDSHRNLLGIVGARIGLAFGDELVDELVAQVAGALFVFGYGLRRKHRKNESAVPVVVGWIAGDGRCSNTGVWAFGCCCGAWHHDDVARCENFVFLGDGDYVVITRWKPRPAPAVRVGNRALRFTNFFHRGIRITHELGVKNIEVSDGVVDRPSVFFKCRHGYSSMMMASSGQLAWARRVLACSSTGKSPTMSTVA